MIILWWRKQEICFISILDISWATLRPSTGYRESEFLLFLLLTLYLWWEVKKAIFFNISRWFRCHVIKYWWRHMQEACMHAYLVIRRNAILFLNLFHMMRSTGIPELNSVKDIGYLQNVSFFYYKTLTTRWRCTGVTTGNRRARSRKNVSQWDHGSFKEELDGSS